MGGKCSKKMSFDGPQPRKTRASTGQDLSQRVCTTPRPNFDFDLSISSQSRSRHSVSFGNSMASSRIFVKGLPPTFTDTEFKKHFGQNSTITDAKIFPNRRIGYVGYKTPEDAQRAVKYFNKSFIRMSRIGVELARPVQDGKTTKQIGTAPTSKKVTNDRFPATQEGSKRKREDGDVERDDTKLKEFLNVMQPKSKKRTLENMEWEGRKQDDEAHITASVDALPEDVSDEDYEDVPSKSKRVQALASAGPKEQANQTESSTQTDPVSEPIMQETQGEPDETGTQAVVSDLDWARSRTSRLLGLLDEDEEAADALRRETIDTSPDANGTPEDIQTKEAKQSNSNDTTPTPSSDHADDPVSIAVTADVLQAARASMRLFVRNLPYDVKEEDLEAEFAPFGNLDEVGSIFLFFSPVMNILIGTADAPAFDVISGEYFSRCFSCLNTQTCKHRCSLLA